MLWKLGGITTSHRSRFVFYFFSSQKETQPNEPGSAPPGAAWREGPAERLAPETPVRRRQRRPPGTRRRRCRATLRGGKTKKHFCSLTSCPDSQVHTSAWKLRAWKTQNPRHKRSGLRRFRSAWRGRRQCLGAVPGCAERICSSAAAGLDDPWAGATGKYGSWGGGDALGQTRRWLHVAVEGVWGLFVGVFILLGAWGYFIIIFYFFLSGSLSFISPQTVVSGKLLLIFKRQREE